MSAIIENNTNEYKWGKGNVLTFKHTSDFFPTVHTITIGSPVHGTNKDQLHFDFYNLNTNSKEQFDELVLDCVKFAEQASGKKCKLAEAGLGHVSTIRVKQIESIW